MATHEAAIRTSVVTATAGAPLCALRAISRPVWLKEVHIWYVTIPASATAGLGIIRSNAIGTGALSGVLGQALNPNDLAGTAEAVSAWGTAAPTTTAANTLRRWLSGTVAIGVGLIWVFEAPGLYVPGSAGATSEICLCNMFATAPGTMDVTFVWSE